MKVLLTGSSGMVGRNILEHKNAGSYEFLTPISSELDLADRKAIDFYLSEHRPDLIIHCAGLVGDSGEHQLARLIFSSRIH